MWAKIPWSLIVRFGLPALVAGFLIFKVIGFFIDVGEKNVQTKWDADLRARGEMIAKLKDKIAGLETQHRMETDAIRNRLADAETSHARELATLRGSYTLRLRESEDRAGIYLRLSEAGATQRANLASYAAQLDRSVVEGRQVVEELRATVVQRDRQLIALGEQLHADRRLINGIEAN